MKAGRFGEEPIRHQFVSRMKGESEHGCDQFDPGVGEEGMLHTFQIPGREKGTQTQTAMNIIKVTTCP